MNVDSHWDQRIPREVTRFTVVITDLSPSLWVSGGSVMYKYRLLGIKICHVQILIPNSINFL